MGDLTVEDEEPRTVSGKLTESWERKRPVTLEPYDALIAAEGLEVAFRLMEVIVKLKDELAQAQDSYKVYDERGDADSAYHTSVRVETLEVELWGLERILNGK